MFRRTALPQYLLIRGIHPLQSLVRKRSMNLEQVYDLFPKMVTLLTRRLPYQCFRDQRTRYYNALTMRESWKLYQGEKKPNHKNMDFFRLFHQMLFPRAFITPLYYCCSRDANTFSLFIPSRASRLKPCAKSKDKGGSLTNQAYSSPHVLLAYSKPK